MKITRAADYAVRVMVHLAGSPPAKRHPLSELAAGTSVQASFLSKILQGLVHQGLLVSHRGSGGGFILNRAPDQITLLDVVEAIEGPTQLNQCVGGSGCCKRKASCGVSPTWERAQASLTEVLGGVSIAQLADETARLAATRPCDSFDELKSVSAT